MNPAQALILAVGAVAAGVTLLLLRFPRMRRAQFRDQPAWSIATSAGAAGAVFGVFALAAFMQR